MLFISPGRKKIKFFFFKKIKFLIKFLTTKLLSPFTWLLKIMLGNC